MKKAQGASAAVVMAGLSAVSAAAAEPGDFVGTWKKNVAESIGMMDPAGQETTIIRRYDTVLDYTWLGVNSTGESSTFSYSGAVDGNIRMLPGDAKLRGLMTKTPSGVIQAKLWFADGDVEEKYCILSAPGKMTCFATFTAAKGDKSLFKEVFDKQ